MSAEEELSILWSKLPTLDADPDVVVLDSPPESPPRAKKRKKKMDDAQASTSGFVGFCNIKIPSLVVEPVQLPDTPEGSNHEQAPAEEEFDEAATKKRRRKKKKKRVKNPVLLEKMIEQIKESGMIEKSRKRTESEDSTKYPKVKWQRYFDAPAPGLENQSMSNWERKREADRAERMARVYKGKVTKIKRRGMGVRCMNCNQWDHVAAACPDKIKKKKCHMCAQEDHLSDRCPESMCMKCGSRTRSFVPWCSACQPDRWAYCRRCNMRGHPEDKCPELWRRFHSTVSGDGLTVSSKTKVGNRSQKPNHKLFCCGCARRGHSIDTCNQVASRSVIEQCGLSIVYSLEGCGETRQSAQLKEVETIERFKKSLQGPVDRPSCSK